MAVDIPPGFKQTSLGRFPEDWTEARIGTSDPFVTSGSRGWARFYSAQGDVFVRITNMNRDSISLDLTDTRRVKLPLNEREGIRTQLAVGDLLVSITADIGIISYVDESIPLPAYINQHIALVRFCDSEVHPKFIAYFLARGPGQRTFRAITDQGAKAGINLQTIRGIPLVAPTDIVEQRAIATALSDVDALLGALDRLIAKQCDLKQATMQQLLTGQTRLPGFSGEWAVKTLEGSADCLDGVRVPLNEVQRNQMQGDIPYCGANGVLDYVDGFVIDDEIILMAEDGGYFDEYVSRPIAYRMTGKCWVNNHAHILKSKDGVDQAFLFYSLVHKDVQPYLASGTRAKLNKAEMNKIEVRFPDAEAEQTAIATVLSDMDAEIAALEARRAKTSDLKQAMMQELLTGRTRLL